MKEHRKLAAIMFTDIVGYTAMMSKDEQKALRILQKSRDLLKSLIKKYNGEWLQAIGDGTLSSFASVVDAVNCALEIQRSLKSDPELNLRIGIHIGDVVFEEGEVYGDGVNVASRLEQLAEPGGICISGQVYRNIRNRPGIEAVFLGEKTLKNVDLPMKIYALSVEKPPAESPIPDVRQEGPKDLLRESETTPGPVKQPMPSKRNMVMIAALLVVVLIVVTAILYFRIEKPASPSERKMLAVLPFENLGPPEDEYFADGITDEIMARIAVIKGLGVIARTSAIQYKNTDKTIRQIGEELGVDYILEGTVRWQHLPQGPSKVRVTPQLIRVSDATHLWANIYDKDLNDIFQVQSDITEQVVEELGIALLEPERRALESKPTDNLQAYDYYLRGNDYFNRSTYEQDYRIAMQMYDKAVELDPGFALAYARLSEAHVSLYWFFYDRTEERLSKSKEAVDKALRLDPDLPEAHLALGNYYYSGRLDYDRALEQFSIAGKSQPNNSDLLAYIGFVRRRQGKFEQALMNIKRASELDPRSHLWALELGITYYLMRAYREAENYYDQAISLSPDWPGPYADKARLYLNWKGSTAKARAVLEEARKVGAVEDPEIDHAWFLIDVFEGNYQEALDRLSSISSEALGTQMYFIPKAQLYARIYGLMGNRQLEQAYYDSARIILETEVHERPEDERFHSSLGITYAGLGRQKDAIREGELAVELLPVSKEAWRGLYRVEDLARIFTMAGEYDSAIDQLELLLSIPGEISIHLLRLDPTWNPLRENLRFQKLVKE